MKSPKPSNTLIATARAVVIAQAAVETLRPRILNIQQGLIDDYGFSASAEWLERGHEVKPLTPSTAYLMSDTDAAVYHAELDKEYRKAGFAEMPAGHCPLLIAENLMRQAERLFMEVSIELTAKAGFTAELIESVITCAGANGLANRKKYLDINLSYVAPFIDRATI